MPSAQDGFPIKPVKAPTVFDDLAARSRKAQSLCKMNKLRYITMVTSVPVKVIAHLIL
jgi:hypothetical protein